MADVRRANSTALLTCPLCSQYFDDPRRLPCDHTFCRKCLQKYFDQRQAILSNRLGRINCPKCKTVIGVPKAGIEAFPVDEKVHRFKDIVIDELAANISKNMHSHSQSDTMSSHSDQTDFSDLTDSKEDISFKRPSSAQTRSRYARADVANDGSDKTGGGFSGNPLYPNMAKYAKYFVKDEENTNAEGYTPRFRPAVRAERRKVGYSSSFQHRRRRINVEPPKGFDDASDILQQSRYGSAPHIAKDYTSEARSTRNFGKDYSSNASSSYSDIFGDMPQSTEELSGSRNFSSRASKKFETTRDGRFHEPSSKFPDDEFGNSTASMPTLSKPRHDSSSAASNNDSTYNNLRNTFSEPKFGYASNFGGTHSAYVNGEKLHKSSTDRVNSQETNDKSNSTRNRTHSNSYSSPRDRQSQYNANAGDKTKTSLPTHRENIVTSSSNENDWSSPGVSLRTGIRSRLKTTPRPHSDIYSDNSPLSHTKAKAEHDPYKTGKSGSSSSWSSKPRSPILERKAPKSTKTWNDRVYTERKNEEIRSQTQSEKEKVPGWYQDAPQSKKRDEYYVRTKPEDEDQQKEETSTRLRKNSEEQRGSFVRSETQRETDVDEVNEDKNYLPDEAPKFHKSASFSTNTWQDNANRVDSKDDISNLNFRQAKLRRKNYYRNINGSFSSGNLLEFDFSIKFELKNRKKFENGEVIEMSEVEQRNAFNDRILNMRMRKERYENIMNDFKNGNLCSDINLQDNLEELNDNAATTATESEVTVAEETASDDSDQNRAISFKVGQPDSVPESQTIVKVQPAKEEPKEEVGRNLKEMLESMRAKYQISDDFENESRTESVILQPVCADNVVPKWNFQKSEFSIPTAIAITSKGNTVVADYGNSCLEFFDADGNYEHKIEGVKPFSIVVNNHDQFVVGDRKDKAVRVFDEYGGDVLQWENGMFSWLSGIALLQNGNIVVHDRDRCKVGIYSLGGEKISEFASYGGSDSQLCMADFLTVDGKNRIIVADSGNHCLKVFDTDGKFLSKIGSRGTADGCLEWPKGVCVDSADNVIVADSQNNRVSMFSPSGLFIQHLVSSAPSPYSVCYSTSTNLLGVTHYALTGFSQYDVYHCS